MFVPHASGCSVSPVVFLHRRTGALALRRAAAGLCLALWAVAVLPVPTATAKPNAAAPQTAAAHAAASADIPHTLRILSLAPNITEILYALGVGEQMVGRTQHCTYPPEAARLPVVGSYFRPDLERILALRPDICFAMADGTPPSLVERLRGLGIRVVVLRPDTVPHLLQAITEAGDVLHRPQEAQALVAAAQALVDTAQASRATRAAQSMHRTEAPSMPPAIKETLVGQGIPPPQGHQSLHNSEAAQAMLPQGTTRPTVLVQIQARPIMVAGPETFLGELVRLAGGESPLPPGSGYVRLSQEAALALDPDIILVAAMEGTMGQEELALWHSRPAFRAVRTGRVHLLDADAVTRPGLRSLEALPHLGALLAPQAVTPVLPAHQPLDTPSVASGATSKISTAVPNAAVSSTHKAPGPGAQTDSSGPSGLSAQSEQANPPASSGPSIASDLHQVAGAGRNAEVAP